MVHRAGVPGNTSLNQPRVDTRHRVSHFTGLALPH